MAICSALLQCCKTELTGFQLLWSHHIASTDYISSCWESLPFVWNGPCFYLSFHLIEGCSVEDSPHIFLRTSENVFWRDTGQHVFCCSIQCTGCSMAPVWSLKGQSKTMKYVAVYSTKLTESLQQNHRWINSVRLLIQVFPWLLCQSCFCLGVEVTAARSSQIPSIPVKGICLLRSSSVFQTYLRRKKEKLLVDISLQLFLFFAHCLLCS